MTAWKSLDDSAKDKDVLPSITRLKADHKSTEFHPLGK